VVGRTGSGKSTLLNTLLEFTEISSGEILIDDISLSTIGLKDLRKSMTVIDQEPVLLNSTFR
jgi:ATP-binding cassette, subfamily C (CFTR/MRP), member 1